MSKDPDGIEENDRRVPAAEAAGVDGTTEPTDLTDPESDAPDALDIEAEMDAAEQAEGIDPTADSDFDDDAVDEDSDVPADAEMAVATAGSSRAAARRSPVRTGTTAKKDAPTKPREVEKREGLVGRLGRFLREVVAELRKVIWPSRKQMATYTVVVIVFLIVMVALVSGLDVLFHLLVGKVLG